MSKKQKRNKKLALKGKKRTAKKKTIVVTVVTVTYNHKDYIKQCLESLVCQKTNFRYQILVGDDCSTDGTTDIVREFAKRYPNLIVPIIRRKNVGSVNNFGSLCQRAINESDFIAFCDGDDYWIDEHKLQKQYEFLLAHPKVGGCFCRSLMLVSDDYYLKDYYRKNEDGQYYYPESIPGFPKLSNNFLGVGHLLNGFFPGPQSIMLRVKEGYVIPEWCYRNKYVGDVPMLVPMTGNRGIMYMPEVMSVYRRNSSSITSYEDMDQNFLFTRPQWIQALTGLRNYYRRYYKGHAVVILENRIKQDTYLYLRTLIKYDMTAEIAQFFKDFPEAGKISLNAYLSFYNDSRKMTRIYGWEGNKTVSRNSKFMHLFKPVVKTYTKLSLKYRKFKAKLRKSPLLKKCLNLLRLFMFWLNCLVPKSKYRWAITSFHNYKYVDNSRYFYEYLVKNHPEIKATWFTSNPGLYKELRSRGWSVSMNNTLAGAWRMARCSIAITDHFRMTDYDPLHGLSNRTKIVQLWHGVGLKSMGNGREVKNTTVPGVMYSTDILPQPEDSIITRFVKKFKYFRHAYYRELFEKYFLFVCPGQERIDMIGKTWNIPEENYLMAGHSRNLPVYETLSETNNYVIYAPTYRLNIADERAMVLHCLKNLPVIQETMERYDSVFVLRLHPHTWRNYSQMIKKAIRQYDRIKYDTTLDIYPNINKYGVVISDYSSVAYDFMMFGKPVVFFCFDYDTFCERDAGFTLDYMESTPGPKTYTWEDTLEEVAKYLEDPSKDAEWRREVLKYFFDEQANGPDDSERITQEIKKRLKI